MTPETKIPYNPAENGIATRFQPGNNANPGGRPKGLARRIREIAPPDELASFYWAVFKNQTDKLDGMKITLKDRIEAGNWLADRGYGKPASFQPVEDGDPLELSDVEKEIHDIADELEKRRKAA